MQDCVDSSFGIADGQKIRFQNRKCQCRRKAEVLISESLNNRYRLFFRCKTNQCGFFEWWNLEDDNPALVDEFGCVSFENEGARVEVQSEVNTDDVVQILQEIRGLKCSISILVLCVEFKVI